MTQYVTLLGAEDVASAGRKMQDAAETFQRALGNFDHNVIVMTQAMEQLSIAMADSASRIEVAVQKLLDKS